MTVIADITLPSATFPIGRVMQSFPDATMEFERVVPLRRTSMSLLWIEGSDPTSVESALEDHPQIEAVDVLSRAEAETLFEILWSPEPNGFIETLLKTGATVLDARGTAESWDFRLRFPTQERLSTFNVALTERGIPVTLRRIYHPPESDDVAPMSPIQYDTLLTAYRRGYFRIPRSVSQADLAEELDISDSALSQRIRRGVSKLIETAIISEDPPLR